MKSILLFACAALIFFGCAGNQVIKPVLKEKTEPVYPYEAKSQGIEGKAEIFLVVNEKGEVEKTKLSKSSGSEILDASALEYGKNLKFEPATLDGNPQSIIIKWIMNYKIENIKTEDGKIRILVFAKTVDVRHASIDAGKECLKKIAAENNFDIDITEDADVFVSSNLARYDVIVFLNTSGDVFNGQQEQAFKQFINDKNGFVGVHNAIDTENKWEWYGKMLGTHLKNYPEVQNAVVRITDMHHPSTRNLPTKWERMDEWVNFSVELPEDVKVLAVVDESSYQGGEAGDMHPFCWYHDFDGGRAWYTAGGHTPESFTDPVFIQHLLGGIKYAAGVE